MQEWKADFKMTMMMTMFPLTPRKPILGIKPTRYTTFRFNKIIFMKNVVQNFESSVM